MAYILKDRARNQGGRARGSYWLRAFGAILVLPLILGLGRLVAPAFPGTSSTDTQNHSRASVKSATPSVAPRLSEADKNLPVSSEPPISGYKTQQTIQAVAASKNAPALFTVEANDSGETIVRAFTADGRQLWLTHQAGSSLPGKPVPSGSSPSR
jgi:hypothetical protein